MRKLRAIYLGAAMAVTAASGTSAQIHVPGQAPQGPQPPSAQQEETFQLLQMLLNEDVKPAEPQIRSIESLEDDFFEGKISEATYRTSRAATLARMYPELATTHQEFESRTNKIVGCTTDGRSYVIPVITLVSRADMKRLTDTMIGTGKDNRGTQRYFAAVTDMSNRLRQGIEDHGPALIGTVTEAQLLQPSYKATLTAALERTATTAGRDARVGVVFRMLEPREVDVVCTPSTAKPAQAIPPAGTVSQGLPRPTGP